MDLGQTLLMRTLAQRQAILDRNRQQQQEAARFMLDQIGAVANAQKAQAAAAGQAAASMGQPTPQGYGMPVANEAARIAAQAQMGLMEQAKREQLAKEQAATMAHQRKMDQFGIGLGEEARQHDEMMKYRYAALQSKAAQQANTLKQKWAKMGASSRTNDINWLLQQYKVATSTLQRTMMLMNKPEWMMNPQAPLLLNQAQQKVDEFTEMFRELGIDPASIMQRGNMGGVSTPAGRSSSMQLQTRGGAGATGTLIGQGPPE